MKSPIYSVNITKHFAQSSHYHPSVQKFMDSVENKAEIRLIMQNCVNYAKLQSETGVQTGPDIQLEWVE